MTKDVESTLEKRLYALYDDQLEIYCNLFLSTPTVVLEDMKKFVNDVQSDLYGKEEHFTLYEIAIFDSKSCSFTDFGKKEICRLDSLIDTDMRNIQVCIQTLNYLPKGYFKMPKELQEPIQEKIDEAIKFYSEKFIANPLKTSSNNSV